jgi:cytochrome c oxidase subunit I+III
MHATGLMGMPRRVYTYPAVMEWGVLNMISTVGAFLFAAGILVFLFDLARNLRPGSGAAGNVWQAGTLEWLPNDVYAVRSIPLVTSREPLWDQAGLAKDVETGRYYLPCTATGARETIVTSPIEAAPQYLLRLPQPGWPPFLAAVFTAGFFMLLTVKMVMLACVSGLLCVVSVLVWMWASDPAPRRAVEIGGGIKLPTYASGPLSHSWWAMIVLMLVAGSLFLAFVFSYLYLWTVSPGVWPGVAKLPPLGSPLIAALLLTVSSGIVMMAGRTLRNTAVGKGAYTALMLAACMALGVALTVEIWAQWTAGLRPDADAHGAMVYMAAFLQLQMTLPALMMAAFSIARRMAGMLHQRRRVVFDNTQLLWHYTVGQSLLGLVLVHGFPRLVA